MLETSCVDTHSHFYPREMLAAIASGRTWHGWAATTGPDGRRLMSNPEGTVALPPATAALSWNDRIAQRLANEHVTIDATMVPRYMFGYHMVSRDAVAYCRDVNDELAQVQRDTGGRVIVDDS